MRSALVIVTTILATAGAIAQATPATNPPQATPQQPATQQPNRTERPAITGRGDDGTAGPAASATTAGAHAYSGAATR